MMPPGDQTWLLVAWLQVALAWLLVLLSVLFQVLRRHSAYTRSERRRIAKLTLAELTCLPELSRAVERGRRRGPAQPHRLDDLLTGPGPTPRRGCGMALTVGTLTIFAVGAITAASAVLTTVGAPRWVGLVLVAAPPLGVAARGLARVWRGIAARRRLGRLRAGLLAAHEAVAAVTVGLRRERPGSTAGDWSAAAARLAELVTDPERLALGRLRCLDRALAAAGEVDREALAADQRRISRRLLGLPELGGTAEREALLAEHGTAAAAEAQVRLLVYHAGQPVPRAWRDEAIGTGYRLLEALRPRLDPIADLHLWRELTRAGGDDEAMARAGERVRAERAVGAAPEPLLNPLFEQVAVESWRAVSWALPGGVGRPSLPSLDQPPPLPRNVGPNQKALASLGDEVARGLDAAELAALLGRLRDPARFPRLPRGIAAHLTWRWAADPRRRSADGLAELVPHLAGFGEVSLLAAHALAGLADGLARYLGPATRAATQAVGAAIDLLDPRLAWAPELALARAIARLDAEAGEQALWRHLTRLLLASRSKRVRDSLIGVLDALALLRAPRAAARLRHTAEGMLRGRQRGFANIEETRRRARGLAAGDEACVIAAARGLRARGAADGEAILAELAKRLGPDDPTRPAQRERLLQLAAAGQPDAVDRALALARQLALGGPPEQTPADQHARVVRQILRRAAAGSMLALATSLAARDAAG